MLDTIVAHRLMADERTRALRGLTDLLLNGVEGETATKAFGLMKMACIGQFRTEQTREALALCQAQGGC